MIFIFREENVRRRQSLKKLTKGLLDIGEFDKLLDELQQSSFDDGVYTTKRMVADKMEELGIRLIEE